MASVSMRWWGVLALVAMCLCARLTSSWENRQACSGDDTLWLQSYGGGPGPSPGEAGGARQVVESGGRIEAQYGFRNFNGDQLHLSFALDGDELSLYLLDYGYTAGDLDALSLWRTAAYADLYRLAGERRLTRQQLDDRARALGDEYLDRRRTFFQCRGFRFLSENLIAPDMPGIVSRNVPRVRDLAALLDREAKSRGYDRQGMIGAALSFVQTALRYEDVPREVDGRITGGISPPLEVLARGRGDCDSKTALLAALLLNWDRTHLVGVGVPGHYLMGILQTPHRGDAFVEYQGLSYVLVEPSGPAWLPPGTVSETTLALVGGAGNLLIEPLAAE